MVTQGCVVVTSDLYYERVVTVAAGMNPVAAKAQSRRTVVLLGGRQKVVTHELPVTVTTNDLVIDLSVTKPGDLVCWTAYSE